MPLKFVFVVGCFLLALTSYFFCVSKKNWFWLTLGLAFTVGADYFLVIKDWHLHGVAVFCFVHVCYILRVWDCKHGFGLFKQTRKGILFLVFAVAVITFSVIFAFANGWLIILASIYAGLFITNIALNFCYCKINRPFVLTGLILFALCDINVALFNLPRQFDIGFTFPWAFQLIWIFYLPSQLLLAVSAVRKKGR